MSIRQDLVFNCTRSEGWRWVIGLIYIVAVAAIWIAASFVVQSVVDAGVSPFFITYICNSLFVVYVPLIEIGRYLEDTYGSLLFWRTKKTSPLQQLGESEKAILLGESGFGANAVVSNPSIEYGETSQRESDVNSEPHVSENFGIANPVKVNVLDAKGRWTRIRMAKVSLLICPFWFLAQLTFNLSLKYTTVTSNTILSTASSLFTFLVSLAFLGEKFTWLKFVSVLLCMAGTIIVSLGDSRSGLSAIASNPVLGDILALFSSGLYSVYITLIRLKLPDDDGKDGQASMAQFLGYLGVFNLLIFLPVTLVLNFTRLETMNTLTWKQLGLIVGKGLLDNVLSDYLWVKAIFLTTTTVATAGLTIQVPLAAMVDALTGNPPNRTDYLGAVVVMIGFAGINIPIDAFNRSKQPVIQVEDNGIITSVSENNDGLTPHQEAVEVS